MSCEIPQLFKQEALTNQKPTVVYVREFDYSDDSTFYEAEAHSVKSSLNCQIIEASEVDICSSKFSLKKKEISFLMKTGGITSFLIEQEADQNYPGYLKPILRKIRELSTEVPVFFIPYRSADVSEYTLAQQDENFFIGTDVQEVLDPIKDGIKSFNGRSNFFGVATVDDIESISEQIWFLHRFSFDDSSSSRNDQIVCQAINLRLLPSEFKMHMMMFLHK